MATGTSSGLLDIPEIQSIYKLNILRAYLHLFIQMVGSKSLDNRLAIFDGYAGKGRYQDGTPGSAEVILRAAAKTAATRRVGVYLVEAQKRSFESLSKVAHAYSSRVDVEAIHGDAGKNLPRVVASTSGIPLFMFLDPTGAVLPFELLESILAGPRRMRYPQTELLLNFNAGFVRRTAGTVIKEDKGQEAFRQAELALYEAAEPEERLELQSQSDFLAPSQDRLNEVCGGEWWKDIARETLRRDPTRFDLVADKVVERYASRLAAAADMHPVVIPVRKRPRHQPLYYLVFLTRSTYGTWVMADAVGKARDEWVRRLGPVAVAEEAALFEFEHSAERQLDLEHERAQQQVEANLLQIATRAPGTQLVDAPEAVFEGVFGFATEKTVSSALRSLEKRGELEASKASKMRNRTIRLGKGPGALAGGENLDGQGWHLVPDPPVEFASVRLRPHAAPLFEEEPHASCDRLVAEVADPVGLDRTVAGSGFTTDDEPVDLLHIEVGKACEKRFGGDELDRSRSPAQ